MPSKSLAFCVTALSAFASALPSRQSPNPRAVRGLNKRQTFTNPHTLGSISCGAFSSADTEDSLKNVSNLDTSSTATAPANGCSRIGCYNTSGVYVCNDNDYEITIGTADAAAFAGLIVGVCDGDPGEGHHPVNGQAFTSDQGGYNVVVAFCDSNEPADTLPSSYAAPGPNGASPVQCNGNSDSACDLGTCQSGLTVLTQTNVACDTYLAANTVGVNASYTYSSAKYITSTWSVGFDLGIDSGDLASASASAGFSFSYSQGTTTGSSTGISQTCGPLTGAQGLFSCGMEIQPGCYEITGTCLSEDSVTYNIAVPFDTIQPQEDSEGGQGVYAPAICTCHNCCDWANPAAPALACFEDCATCQELPDNTCPS